VHNLRPYEDFSCYRSFLDWKRMLTENKDLFVKVTLALSSSDPAPSVPYERLEAEVAAFVQKYFQQHTCLNTAYKSFRPGQLIRSLPTPPVPIHLRHLHHVLVNYTKTTFDWVHNPKFRGQILESEHIKRYTYDAYH
jgi:hypothetical protein